MALDGTLHRVFVQNLRALRKAGRLSQEALADRMGITQSSYSDLENGRFSPTIGTIEKAAVALGVAAEELLATRKPASAVA